MYKQKIIIGNNPDSSLVESLSKTTFDKLFILTDTNTLEHCFPLFSETTQSYNPTIIKIQPGDTYKNLETLAHIWTQLSSQNASRHSLLVNLGGGMVTDIGGFAAATFKRGINYINIPTTLLAMVDASVGGKTGINFHALKNEIGVFSPASNVIISTQFLQTLDSPNLLSGYAEMLKHGLITTNEHWNELLGFTMTEIDYPHLQSLVEQSILIKEKIVEEDPYEQNIRKALNLGHTVGHAFESLALEENRPLLHGYAVAWGLVCELYLSYIHTNFPKEKLFKTLYFIKENYGGFDFTCKNYNRLLEFMLHDKKNQSGIINFTLLEDIGNIKINQTATQQEIVEMFDFYQEYMGV